MMVKVPRICVPTVGVPVTVKLSPGAVWLSAEQLIVPVPGVVVAVTVRPETVALAVLVEVQAGEMHERVEESDRVAVQVST
jgi:hypothetical protein